MPHVSNVTLARVRLCSAGEEPEATAARILGEGMRLLIAWQSPRVPDRINLMHVPTQATAVLPLSVYQRRLLSADPPGRSTRRWLRQASRAYRRRLQSPPKWHKALVDALLAAMSAANSGPGTASAENGRATPNRKD